MVYFELTKNVANVFKKKQWFVYSKLLVSNVFDENAFRMENHIIRPTLSLYDPETQGFIYYQSSMIISLKLPKKYIWNKLKTKSRKMERLSGWAILGSIIYVLICINLQELMIPAIKILSFNSNAILRSPILSHV